MLCKLATKPDGTLAIEGAVGFVLRHHSAAYGGRPTTRTSTSAHACRDSTLRTSHTETLRAYEAAQRKNTTTDSTTHLLLLPPLLRWSHHFIWSSPVEFLILDCSKKRYWCNHRYPFTPSRQWRFGADLSWRLSAFGVHSTLQFSLGPPGTISGLCLLCLSSSAGPPFDVVCDVVAPPQLLGPILQEVQLRHSLIATNHSLKTVTVRVHSSVRCRPKR